MSFFIGGNMATYTRGLKINEKAIAQYTENLTAQTVRRAQKVGELVNKELREESVIEWFNGNGFSRNESWYTMLHSLDYMKTKVYTHNGIVTLDFISYINPQKYNIEHTSLYRQKDKYSGIDDPYEYIVGYLQWENGIIGLPERSSIGSWRNNYFYKADMSLSQFTEYTYRNRWRKRLNKYWKTMGNGLLSKL